MPSRIASPSDHPAADVRRPGIRGVALLELAIFFAGAFAVDLLFADGTRFRDIEPHPYWIPVLLLSIQYGTNEGLLAAALASAALLVNNLPAQTLTQDEFDYLFSISYRPIIWFVAAVALGEIRNRQVREREELRRELAASQQEAQTITETYQKMKAVKTDLEVRLASELRTVLSMYEAAKAIDRLNVGEVLSGVGTLLEAIVRPQKYSLFLLNNNVLEAALAEGWAPDDSYARIHTPDSPLFEGVVARQHVLCAARPEDVPLLDGQGVLAGPLRSADTDAIVGMLKIEDVGFLEFNLTTIENFRMLCDWIGTALAKARRYEAMGEDRFHGSSDHFLSAAILDHETRFLGRLGKRMGFESCAISIRPERAARLRLEERDAIADAVGRAVVATLRGTDVAFDHGRRGRGYAVLLPGTSADHADIVVERLDRAIRERLPPALADHPLRIAVEPVTPGDD